MLIKKAGTTYATIFLMEKKSMLLHTILNHICFFYTEKGTFKIKLLLRKKVVYIVLFKQLSIKFLVLLIREKNKGW